MFATLMCMLTLPHAAQSPWKLVWADNFDYVGLPDPQKWVYEKGKVRNNELQFYTDGRFDNARVEGRHLIIEGVKESYRGSDYTSASITTQGKFDFTYGRVEVRAKLPQARGTWPAIWMLGSNIDKVGWPKCGEIDIMEHVGHIPPTIFGTVHQADASGQHVSLGGRLDLSDDGAGYHNYAVEWTPQGIDFFVDDTKYFTYPHDETHPWTFDHPMYLLINLAIGGSWGGQQGVDAAAFPQFYEIQYVRVFQRKGEE